MRILFLTGRLPYPPNRGDRLRAYHFLRVLSREHRISLLSFIADPRETANVSPLRAFCEDIQIVHHGRGQALVGAGINAWRSSPLQSLYYRSPVMHRAVTQVLARGQFAAVYVHLFRMAQYLVGRSNPYRILDLTDAISGEVERSLPYLSPLWRLIYRIELPRIRRYEKEILPHFDDVWVISEAERAALSAAALPHHIHVVPNGVEAERYRPALRNWSSAGYQDGEPILAFVGHMSVFHNIDAAEYLARVILPRIRAQIRTAGLHLIGAEPAPRVLALGREPGVKVLGNVNDLNAALNAAAVFVAPLRFAAGLQNKVLEAMAAGLPVVTTAQVNRGIRAESGRDLIVADETAAQVEAIVSLLLDAQERRRLGRNGRDFALSHFRWEDVLDHMNRAAAQHGG